MQGRVVLDFGPNGIEIHSALADGNGQPAPDALVKAILLSAWEIMLTKCIAEGIKNERRVISIGEMLEGPPPRGPLTS